MKKSELIQIIKEEVDKILTEIGPVGPAYPKDSKYPNITTVTKYLYSNTHNSWDYDGDFLLTTTNLTEKEANSVGKKAVALIKKSTGEDLKYKVEKDILDNKKVAYYVTIKVPVKFKKYFLDSTAKDMSTLK